MQSASFLLPSREKVAREAGRMTLRSAARRMRHEPTFNERVLWKLLRNRRLEYLKFRRQVPLGPYVVDFICFGARLIVEADGPLHDADADARRDAWLKHQGPAKRVG